MAEPSDSFPAPAKSRAASRQAIDWSARNRTTSTEVQRYSRFVVIMKRALPMAAAALLAAVVAYSLQPRLQDGKKLALTLRKVGILTNDLVMSKPRLTGADGEGNPYVVTAAEAIQDPNDSKRARLEKIEADLTQKSGRWLNMSAGHGWLDQKAQKLSLWGVVDAYSDNGYEVHTTAAAIDMQTGGVVGNAPAWGQGPLGTFRADSFRIDRGVPHAKTHGSRVLEKLQNKDQKSTIYLYGHVQMAIYRQAHR